MLAFVLVAAPAALAATTTGGHGALSLPRESPAALGFAPKGLDRVEKFIRGEIDAKHYAGAVWLVARDGKIAAHGASGLRDVDGNLPMTEDTIFVRFPLARRPAITPGSQIKIGSSVPPRTRASSAAAISAG